MSDSVRASAAYGLHPYQRQVARELLGFLMPDERRVVAENRRAVAHLPTGAGKTRIASYVACQLLNTRDESRPLRPCAEGRAGHHPYAHVVGQDGRPN